MCTCMYVHVHGIHVILLNMVTLMAHMYVHVRIYIPDHFLSPGHCKMHLHNYTCACTRYIVLLFKNPSLEVYVSSLRTC